MNYWIFQTTPERYDLRKELKEGKEVIWHVTRYRSRMDSGDLVFFWLAGPEEMRGIYGWGKLLSRPYRKPQQKLYAVNIKVEGTLRHHLTVKRIREHPALETLVILRAPQGTNFALTSKEGQVLEELVHQTKQRVPTAKR